MKRTENYVSVAHNLSLNAHMMVCAGRQSAKIEISKKYVHVLAVFQLADAIAFTIAHASISPSHFRWKCPINYFVISAFLPSGVGLTAMKMAHTRPTHHMKRDNLSATIYILSLSFAWDSFWFVCENLAHLRIGISKISCELSIQR